MLLGPEKRVLVRAAPFKSRGATRQLPAEYLQDVGLDHFILGGEAVVPVTETVNCEALTLYWNVCVCVCFCFLEPR